MKDILITAPYMLKDKNKVLAEAEKLKKQLQELSPLLDDREDYSPGWKFSDWELKGIPLRIEIGPRDIKDKQVIVVKRNDGKKLTIKLAELEKQIPKILEEIQTEIYKTAEKFLKGNTDKAEDFEELNSEILELIAEIDAGGLNTTHPDDLLTIELFELDTENEEIGEIY